MTDDLVKILRDGWTEDGICDDFESDVLLIAAHRIEELEQKLIEADKQIKELENELENMEYEMCEMENRQ
jgi:hypothetical protein